MRAYSRSLGKVVEVPDSQPAASGVSDVQPRVPASATPTGDYAPPGGTNNLDKMRAYLLGTGLQNLSPDNASSYTALFNITKPTAAEIAEKGKTEEIGQITRSLSDINKLVTKGDRNIKDIINFNTKSKLTSQSVARLWEKGRLSDADRDFYRTNFPSLIEYMILPDVAKDKIDAIDNYLRTRSGSAAEEAAAGSESGGLDALLQGTGY